MQPTLSTVTTNEDQEQSRKSTLQASGSSPDIFTTSAIPTPIDQQTTVERQIIDSTTPRYTTVESGTSQRVNESPTTTTSSDMPKNGLTTMATSTTNGDSSKSASTKEQSIQLTERSTPKLDSTPSHTERLGSTGRQAPDTTEHHHESWDTTSLSSTEGK